MSLTGYLQRLLINVVPKRYYFEDALITTHNHSFVSSPSFKKAYARGLKATKGQDCHNRWRVNVALWVAGNCAKLDGDFVELGVNYGLTSSAIMEDLNWNNLGKQFWLVDSFAGIDQKQATPDEKSSGKIETNEEWKKSGFYNSNAEHCRRNFSEWKTANVIQGWVPDCLDQITSTQIAYLHIDLNSAQAELSSFKSLLPKLCIGAIVLLDDYAYVGFESTFKEWNKLADKMDFKILALPTGQGIIQITPDMKKKNL